MTPSNLPTPENFPKAPGGQKIERAKQESGAEQSEQKETLEDAVSQGMDQAQAAADIFTSNMQGRMQAINNQGMLKQSDNQMLHNLIQQGQSATNNLKSQLSQLISDDEEKPTT